MSRKNGRFFTPYGAAVTSLVAMGLAFAIASAVIFGLPR